MTELKMTDQIVTAIVIIWFIGLFCAAWIAPIIAAIKQHALPPKPEPKALPKLEESFMEMAITSLEDPGWVLQSGGHLKWVATNEALKLSLTMAYEVMPYDGTQPRTLMLDRDGSLFTIITWPSSQEMMLQAHNSFIRLQENQFLDNRIAALQRQGLEDVSLKVPTQEEKVLTLSRK